MVGKLNKISDNCEDRSSSSEVETPKGGCDFLLWLRMDICETE
jgi:hypothetical protein